MRLIATLSCTIATSAALVVLPLYAQDSAPPPGGGQASPAQAEATVVEGPLAEMRKQFLLRLQSAEKEGIGTRGYLTAFQALEQSVKSGEAAERIQVRLQSLHQTLTEQLERKRLLKSGQVLPPPRAGSDTPGGAPPDQGGGKLGAGSPMDLLEKYKDRPEMKAIQARPEFQNLKNRPDLQDRLKDMLDKYVNK